MDCLHSFSVLPSQILLGYNDGDSKALLIIKILNEIFLWELCNRNYKLSFTENLKQLYLNMI